MTEVSRLIFGKDDFVGATDGSAGTYGFALAAPRAFNDPGKFYFTA